MLLPFTTAAYAFSEASLNQYECLVLPPYIFTSSRSPNFETTSSIVADNVSTRVYPSHVLPTERFELTTST